MAHQCHNLTLDQGTKLADSANFTVSAAGAVSGGLGYVDFGGANAYSKFAVVIDWTACEAATNELYTVVVQGSTTSAFSGTPYRLAQYAFGHSSVTGHPVTTSPTGRRVIYGDNVVITSASDGNSISTMQYLRVYVFVAGTIDTTGMTLSAWLVPLP